jgi:hypothetical protein
LVSLENHTAKHGQEKRQKTITEPFLRHKLWCRSVSGTFTGSSQFGKQLPSAAEIVAESFIPKENSQNHRHQKIDHPQPRKKDIKISQNEITDRPDPEVIVPMFFLHTSASFTSIQPAGQVLAQRPHPTHVSSSTTAKQPFQMEMAFFGQTFTQAPQETQIF